VLFVPVISKHTHERAEGYFRLEWKLAVDRCHLMAADKAFLVPVVIDDTPDDDERVPEKFRELQWIRLPEGNAGPEFATRIQQLLAGESGRSPTLTRAAAPVPAGRLPGLRSGWLAVAIVLAALAAYLLTEKPWTSKPAPHSKPAASTDTPVAFNPPPHSIAVLPFVNMSGDKEQEYFSDGLTEELLNSLSRINELQVAARTSSFSFQGEHPDIATVARKLNVASVLEGSVRLSRHTIRVTAQLNNAVTGFHIWSQTYDRDLGDVLRLQTEIASAVANALKVTLLGDLPAKIELSGTHNPAAFDAYLRGSKAVRTVHNASDARAAVDAYTEAIRQDPHYAQAFAARSLARYYLIFFVADATAVRQIFDAQQNDAREALRLAPGLSDGHLALARAFEDSLDFARASEEFERAMALAPGDVRVVLIYGIFSMAMGRNDAAVAALNRAVGLDPLNPSSYEGLGLALYSTQRYPEAIAAYDHALALDPDSPQANGLRGHSYYKFGDFQRARMSCEITPEFVWSQTCLAMTYNKLGQHGDAEAVLAKLRASGGDAAAYQYAQIYAQWGQIPKALEWLETALRLRDGGLLLVKTDPLLDPLRQEPRFQAIERALHFPD
jgi:TolB-like protein/Tfp pilus assembly protein PilF